MQSMYILIPMALIFAGLAIAVFFWAVNTDQYDDLDREGHSILFDEFPEAKTQDKDTDDHKIES